MKGKQTALMPGNEDKVGYWLTPPDLMAQLQAEFDFNFDACPYPRPVGFDGLKEPWGKRTWVNPPFRGSASRWARKTVEENVRGNLVVMIPPIFRAEATLLRAGAEVRYVGPVEWRDPAGIPSPTKDPAHQALFILRPKSVHPKSDEQPPRQEARSAPSDEGGDEQT